MRAIVTVVDLAYLPLVEGWYKLLIRSVNLPVFIIVTDPEAHEILDSSPWASDLHVIMAKTKVPFQIKTPEHAAAYKLLVFEELPGRVNTIVFLDLDTLVLEPLSHLPLWLNMAHEHGAIVGCLDNYVGYKERLGEEMRVLDPTFTPTFFQNGSMKYINTGLFVVDRKFFQTRLGRVLDDWIRFVELCGFHPSILDQNIFNYHLQKYQWPLQVISPRYNCLRTDEPILRDGRLWIGEDSVAVYHLNGGDCATKLERRNTCLRSLKLSAE